MRGSVLGLAFVLSSLPVFGQAVSPPSQRAELALTYSAARSNTVQGASFWSQGGTLAFSAQLHRGLSIVAEGSGAHATGAGVYSVPFDTFSITFGPRYTIGLDRGSRFSTFGQVLAGEGYGLNGVYPSPNGASSSAHGLATEVGGGFDVRLKKSLAIRAVQADWVRTQLPNGTTNVQNNLRLEAGLVWRLH